MNTKIYFWCKALHENTKFYSFVVDGKINDFKDDDLADQGIVEQLQYDSLRGVLENWGVIKFKITDEQLSMYTEDDFLPETERMKFLIGDELELIKSRNEVKKFKRFHSIDGLSSLGLNILYTELHQHLKKIKKKFHYMETEEALQKRVEKRKELLKEKGFISESGWIDRTGRYWNVQSIDHDEVAIEKWGSIYEAERNNVRVTASGFGTYVMFNFQDALRGPNNKQMRTLKHWGENFSNEHWVDEFEKEIAVWFK